MKSDRSTSARFHRGPATPPSSLPSQHPYYGLPSSSSSASHSRSHSQPSDRPRIHFPPTKDNNASTYLTPLIALIVLAATLLAGLALVALTQSDPATSLDSIQALFPELTAAGGTDGASTACAASASSTIALPDITTDPTLAFAPHPALKPTPEYLATLPSRCGKWMADYAAFHSSVASGRYFVEQLNATGAVPVLPLLVYRVDPKQRLGGISDRWPPLSTAMLVALLTRRAIFIDWPGYDAAYTHIYLPYLVNTTWPEVYSKWQWYKANADAIKAALQSHTPLPTPPPYNPAEPPTIPPTDVLDTGTHDNGLTFPRSTLVPKAYVVIEELTSLDDIRRYYQPQTPIVYATQAFWSKGLITKFYAGGMRDVLLGLGLRENVCHGCMINFLLSINRQVMAMFAPYALQLLRLDVTTVGVQIRMGDASMTGLEGLSEKIKADIAWQQDDRQLMMHVHKWINCSQQLLAVHATGPDQPTQLFLVSDNTRVRTLLQQEFGERLLMVPTGSDEFPIGHTDTGDPKLFNASRSTLHLDRAGQYLRVAAGEQWILAYSDWLVIEHEGSGFGRSASFRSVKVGHTWNGRARRRCDGEQGALTVKDFDIFGHRY